MCFAVGPEPVANAARLANAFTRNFLRSTIVVGLGNADVEMKPSRWLALNSIVRSLRNNRGIRMPAMALRTQDNGDLQMLCTNCRR